MSHLNAITAIGSLFSVECTNKKGDQRVSLAPDLHSGALTYPWLTAALSNIVISKVVSEDFSDK